MQSSSSSNSTRRITDRLMYRFWRQLWQQIKGRRLKKGDAKNKTTERVQRDAAPNSTTGQSWQ
jgi:hypothetical protein